METTTTSTNRGPTGFRQERMQSFVLRFLNSIKKLGRSSHTIAAYRNDLTLFSAFLEETGFDPADWGVDSVAHWDEYLRQHGRRSPASARRAMMSVRTFLRFLVEDGILETSPFLESKSPEQPVHDLLVVSERDFGQMCDTLWKAARQDDDKAIRDLALVLVLGECGLKASEVAGLRWADVVLSSEGPLSGTLAIQKGNERVIPFGAEVGLALKLLRETRTQLGLSTSLDAHLFFGYANLTRRVQTPHLHRHGIKFVIYEVCQETLGAPFNAESLRNRAIRRWIREGLENTEVAKLAGYSSLHSLERFLAQGRRTRKSRRRQKQARGRG